MVSAWDGTQYASIYPTDKMADSLGLSKEAFEAWYLNIEYEELDDNYFETHGFLLEEFLTWNQFIEGSLLIKQLED